MKFEDVKPGTYVARAKTWGYNVAGTGTEQLIVNLTVRVPTGRKGDDGKPVVDAEGRPEATEFVMSRPLYFTEGAWKSTRGQLAAMGWNPPEEQAEEAFGELLEGKGPLGDHDVSVQLDWEKYDKVDEKTGTKTPTTELRIKWINPLGGGGLEIRQPTPTEKAEFSRRVAALFKKDRAAATGNSTPRPSINGPVKAKETEIRPPAEGDEDVPF